jgi:D-glycero-alpha-D-manno-heptose-7-phosphate kinase
MIVTQTPLRISFFGGGTDFKEYYGTEDGLVVSSAIDKYIYVIIKRRFDEKIRIGYTKTELVDSVDEVEHDLVRESLRKTGLGKQVEISTMGDIPSRGSGLGSSSTVTVGLLNAMYTYQGVTKDAETLARDSCEIEIERLKRPIGKQDQYIAAYGGLRSIIFLRDEEVRTLHVGIDNEVRRELGRNLMLFYTGICRDSGTVLNEQVNNIKDRLPVLRRLKAMAQEATACLREHAFEDFGCLLNESWKFKKQLASGISNGTIDAMYSTARKAGAIGGKVSGAGGGGFMLLYCPPSKQPDVRRALHGYRELPFNLETDGSKVIFNYRRS